MKPKFNKPSVDYSDRSLRAVKHPTYEKTIDKNKVASSQRDAMQQCPDLSQNPPAGLADKKLIDALYEDQKLYAAANEAESSCEERLSEAFQVSNPEKQKQALEGLFPNKSSSEEEVNEF